MSDVVFSLAQDIGMRDLQEDFCGYRFSNKMEILQGRGQISGSASLPFMAVLCDGMGGHASGEIASKIAGESFLISTLAAFDDDDASAQFNDIIFHINKSICDHIQSNYQLAGMGTTFIGLKITNNTLKWISVGDSHLFLYRDNKLHKINEDHSMKPLISAMVDKGIITALEAETHPERNALRSALTGDELKLIDIQSNGIPLLKDDIILLASDGIDSMPLKNLERTIKFWKLFGLTKMVKKIISSVLNMKIEHQDNVSLFAIKV